MGLMNHLAKAGEAGRLIECSEDDLRRKTAGEIIAEGEKEIPATAATALAELAAQLDGIDRALEVLVQVLAPLCMQNEERMKTLTPPPPCSKHAAEIYELAQRAESVKEELVGLLNTINLN